MASEPISYVCFDELIASLRNDGCADDADRMHILLHEVAWTTGSELIGELGQELKRIEQQGAHKRPAYTLDRIEECFRMVFRVWPDFPRSNDCRTNG
jgi:hypothetical protein